MDIYHYHPATGEYLGTSEADKSPREQGVFLVPGFATTIAPPDEAEGFIRTFINGEWKQVEIPVPPVDVDGNIRNAPPGLFGGPTLEAVFHGN